MLALPLAALPSSRLTYVKDYFGLNVPITHPLLTPAALLICAVRLEAARADTPSPIPALAGHESNNDQASDEQTPRTPFADWNTGCSKQYEHDWMRLITCYSPWTQPMIRRNVFTPGMMTGTWVGRMFVRSSSLEFVIVLVTLACMKEIPLGQFYSVLDPFSDAAESPQLNVYPKPMRFHLR